MISLKISVLLTFHRNMCTWFFSEGSRRNLVAMTHSTEESSEDMNKGAGKMDEGSVERQDGDRDGWSEESTCTGATPGREFTDAQRRSGRDFGKMTSQEIEVGGDNEHRQGGGETGGREEEVRERCTSSSLSEEPRD